MATFSVCSANAPALIASSFVLVVAIVIVIVKMIENEIGVDGCKKDTEVDATVIHARLVVVVIVVIVLVIVVVVAIVDGGDCLCCCYC